jgi:hypothetical protein
MSRNYPENALQRAAVKLLVLRSNCAGGTEWAFTFWATPNARAGNPKLGAQLRQLGVRAGVPDLVLVFNTGIVGFIELKAPGGRKSPAQESFEREVGRLGCIIYVCKSIKEISAAVTAMQAAAGRRR